MCPTKYEPYYTRHLPHVHPPGATFFVTTRLAGSMPQWRMDQLGEEARLVGQRLSELGSDSEKTEEAYQAHRKLFARWDHFLDCADHGPTWLTETPIAQIVSESLHYRDGSVYELLCYCIMPNHLHLVFRPLQQPNHQYRSVTRIMQSFKGYTAFEANKLRGRGDQFWQHESYDHWVRDEAELVRIVRYVVSNPVKAGLVESWEDWPWTYCRYPL